MASDYVAASKADVQALKESTDKQNELLTKALAQPHLGLSGVGGQNYAIPRDDKAAGRFGWPTLGHFMADVRDADKKPEVHYRLDNQITKAIKEYLQKAAAGMTEAVGPDGGYLIPPTYADGIMEIVHSEESLIDKCDRYDMAGPSMKFRAIDETSRATGSRRGGIRGYWVDEAADITASKPKFRPIELTAHKVGCLFYATEELLADAPMLQQAATRYAGEELNFLINDAIINGDGVGKPLGLLNSACLVSVTKETGQAAATLMTENLVKMWSRLHASARKNAIWLINQDVEPQLLTLTLGIGTAGVVTYMPPGGLSDKPYATLMGRPVIETEFNPTIGTVGDVVLCDPKAYLAATRGTIQTAVSIHVQFVSEQQAFRFTYRVAGQPWWHSALTPYRGTNTQSPFVAIGTRS
jgi:HK97 family phage major capsid protein